MSTKRPDVLVLPPSPQVCLTLGEMHQARWTIHASCRRCGLRLRVNLKLLIRVHGPDAMWWGHTPPCPAIRSEIPCDGQLIYSAQSINGGSWVSMKDKPHEQYVQAWLAKRGVFHGGPR